MPITDHVERFVAAPGGTSGGTEVVVFTNPATGAVEARQTTFTNPATGLPVTVTVALVAVNDSPVDMPLKLLDANGSLRTTLTFPAMTSATRTVAQLAAVGISTRAQAQAIELTNG